MVVGSGRGPLTGASEEVEALEEDETVRIGEKLDIADPGLACRFLLVIAAFVFWASIIVSFKEGFGGPVVLFEKPIPGRATTGSAFLGGEWGLSGAFRKSFCWVASRVSMILEILSGFATLVKSQEYLRFCLCRPNLSKCPVC